MDAVDVITFISQMITGFLAGVGAATYIIFRRWSRHMEQRMLDAEVDIMNMFLRHGWQPPAWTRQNLRDEINSRETNHD